jgi:Spy/CpxP family protein refolding chaperone
LMLFRMRQVLTPEQREKMNALHERRDRDRDRRQPGHVR